MANITRYDPFEDFFKDFGKGFWLRPVRFPAEGETDDIVALRLF